MRARRVWPLLACLAGSFAPSPWAPPPALAGAAESFGSHAMGTLSGSASDVCSFCHTPEGLPGEGADASPGWAAAQPRPVAFRSFDSIDGGGAIVARDGVSVACLSCHDGSQAPDIETNAPDVSGAPGGGAPARPMSLDHPVGIVFSGFDAQQVAGPVPEGRLRQGRIGGQTRWWLDMETVPNGVRDKTDLIFYTRGVGVGAQPYVECATCHDPHANPGEHFLRAPQAGSNLCKACHSY
ncbi:MAG TPA: cytochrome c3 family protein [Thermohalobaculum sp.]|nr:cytochrome c3 family protein [Thermohalobaculum sp.]